MIGVYMLISLFKGVGFFVLTHLMLASVTSILYLNAEQLRLRFLFSLPPTSIIIRIYIYVCRYLFPLLVRLGVY